MQIEDKLDEFICNYIDKYSSTPKIIWVSQSQYNKLNKNIFRGIKIKVKPQYKNI